MADKTDKKIDKTRQPQEGVRSFIGTGVAIDPDIFEEEDDLAEKIRSIVAEMTPNIVEEVAGEVVQNLTVINRWARNVLMDVTTIWNAIWNLESGTASEVKVYKWISNHAEDGQYNCYLQDRIAGAWADVNTITVVVNNVVESDGHAFNSEVFFFSIGTPDVADVTPVNVLEMSIKKAYVRTTPGATTTLACYLDKDDTGTEIDVACVIYGGGNLNAAVPSVVDGDYIWVKRVGATWVNVTTFFAVEDCP